MAPAGTLRFTLGQASWFTTLPRLVEEKILPEHDDVIWEDIQKMLYSDIKEEERYWAAKPLLAHYTSVANLENILKYNEIWLSNPLLMNDLEEVRFGVNVGFELAMQSTSIHNSLRSDSRIQKYRDSLIGSYNQLAQDHVLDLYVACFSEHDSEDLDGRLSMWRGYGSNGNGAALVLDTSKIPVYMEGPLILAKVVYATTEQRRSWIEEKTKEVASYLDAHEVADEHLYLIADGLFERITTFAVFTKQSGFSEEREWRLAYRKRSDVNNAAKKMLSYHNGIRGMEPKLKLKIEPKDGMLPPGSTLSNLVSTIILGPTGSTPLSRFAVCRMLEKINVPELASKVFMSTIPFRP